MYRIDAEIISLRIGAVERAVLDAFRHGKIPKVMGYSECALKAKALAEEYGYVSHARQNSSKNSSLKTGPGRLE